MTPLALLKSALNRNLGINPRTLALVEIGDLEESILGSTIPSTEIINFPLPLPSWTGSNSETSHVLKSWTWESDGALFLLVKLPDITDDGLRERVSRHLNTRSDILGRFFLSSEGGIHYLNPQLIYCAQPSGKEAIRLYEKKAARVSASHIVMFWLAGAVKDLSFSLHLMDMGVTNDKQPARAQ